MQAQIRCPQGLTASKNLPKSCLHALLPSTARSSGLPDLKRCVATQARRARRTGTQTGVDTNSAGDSDVIEFKRRALEKAMQEINIKYGKGSIMRSDDDPVPVQRTASGCLSLDLALGGGYPKGRIIEVFGPESCGKTTLALHAIAEVQKTGGTAMIVDVEQALDREHAKRLGVDVNQLVWSQPSFGEEALDIVDTMAMSGGMDLIVLDSVSALVPRAELEGDIGATVVGNQARLMSQCLRKLIGTANKSNCSIIFINQLRQKVGVMYGNPETTSGGNALRYYSTVRIDLRKKEVIKNGEDTIGIKVKAKIVKNKVASPMREATFDILFDRGIDNMGSLVDAAEQLNVIFRKGAWYYLNDGDSGEVRLGQGRENALEMVRADEALQKRIEGYVTSALGDAKLLAEDDDDELLEEVDEFDDGPAARAEE